MQNVIFWYFVHIKHSCELNNVLFIILFIGNDDDILQAILLAQFCDGLPPERHNVWHIELFIQILLQSHFQQSSIVT